MRKSSRYGGRRSPATRKHEKNNSVISDNYKNQNANSFKLNENSSRNENDFDVENGKEDLASFQKQEQQLMK